ncbi:MAG: phosphonomutase [Frankiales bacterium]|nr:phosphonomutase [Frankiales bacterium]
MSEQAASAFRNLHSDPELLVLVNVWDVISARVVADLPGCRALATASHSIAASLGYEDGENIPVDEMLAAVGRIAAATSLPVTADLEGGYGDPGETVRRAIALGVVGANIEDRNRPLGEAVGAVEAVLRAAEAEGVPSFVLNARTDAFLLDADRPREQLLADAIARGRAFVDAGAPVVFVPGKVSAEEVAALVDGIGPVSLICSPASIPLSQMQELGVQRASLGPWSQRIALTGLASAGETLLGGGAFPSGVQALN